MGNPEKHCEVAIIGGGLAGLTAASLLQEAGTDFCVLEASSRLGGRIESVRDGKTGAYLGDLGPTWVWPPYQASVRQWIQKLNIETFPQYEQGHSLIDLDPDASPARQFLPGQYGMARIVGGPSAFVDALSGTIDSERVLTNCFVTKVERTGDLFQLRFNADGFITSKRVIAAAPLRLMAERIDLSGVLDDSITSIMSNAPTWMATQTKATIQYNNPFWRAEGLSGRVASRVGPLVEVHDHCGKNGSQAALFGFVGWPLEMRQQQDLKAAIVDQLARCFGDEAGDFTRMDIRDWATCPNICSERDLKTIAEHPQQLSDIMRQGHCNDRLFFAAAESASESPGLIDGALESGGRAAQWVLTP